eukprot:jgi/Psemu1/353/gm1.353_g
MSDTINPGVVEAAAAAPTVAVAEALSEAAAIPPVPVEAATATATNTAEAAVSTETPTEAAAVATMVEAPQESSGPAVSDPSDQAQAAPEAKPEEAPISIPVPVPVITGTADPMANSTTGEVQQTHIPPPVQPAVATGAVAVSEDGRQDTLATSTTTVANPEPALVVNVAESSVV